MKKKVIGLCILLLVLLLGLSTVCYAATGPAVKVEGLGTTSKEEIFEILYEKFFGVDINTLPVYQQNYIINCKDKWTSDSTYSVFNTGIDSGYNYVFFTTGNYIGNSNNYSNGITIRNQSTRLTVLFANPLNISWQNSNYNYGLTTNSPYFLFQNPNDNYAWYEYSSVSWSIADELKPNFNFVPTDSIGTITLPHDNGKDTAYCIKPNNIFSPGVDGFIELGQVTTYTNFNDLAVYCMVYDRVVSGETMSGSVVGSSYFYLDNNGKLFFNPIKLYESLLYQFLFRETDANNNTSLAGTVYFYVGYPSNNPVFGSGDFSWSNPQVFVEGLIGSPGGGGGTGFGSGDSPGTGILGGISSFFRNLFIPKQDFFTNYFNDLESHFSTHFGFIYDSYDLIIDILTRIQNIDYTDQTMTLGPYILPLNDDFELIPEITFDFNDYIENDTMNTIHNYYYLIIDGFLIFGLFLLLEREYDRIIADKEG